MMTRKDSQYHPAGTNGVFGGKSKDSGVVSEDGTCLYKLIAIVLFSYETAKSNWCIMLNGVCSKAILL